MDSTGSCYQMIWVMDELWSNIDGAIGVPSDVAKFHGFLLDFTVTA